jgi:opacity protein-like surface antigen
MKRMLLALVAILCLTFAASAADISGKWVTDTSAAPAAGAPAGGGGGGGRMGGGGTYEFKVSGSKLTGSITNPGRGGGDPTVTALTDGKFSGDTFSFSVTRSFGGNDMKIDYTGKVVGDKLEISFDMGGRGPRTITLMKAPQ